MNTQHTHTHTHTHTHIGTAQLQGNVYTHPRCNLHTFQTHPARVPDMTRMHSEHVLHLAKKGLAVT